MARVDLIERLATRHAERARAGAVASLLAWRLDLSGARIALLGAAFKAGTDDLRSAASLRLAERLIAAGAQVTVHDPICAEAALRRALPAGTRIVPDIETALERADAAVLMIAAPEYRHADWSRLARLMARPLLLDVWDVCPLADGPCERLRLGRTDAAAAPAQDKRHVAS